jgi:transcriptional regulator with XRE-family HTH domain
LEIDVSEQFEDRLKRLRRREGLTQANLARKAGVALDSLQNWEIARCSPRLDAVVALARALGVSLDELALGRPAGDERPRKK